MSLTGDRVARFEAWDRALARKLLIHHTVMGSWPAAMCGTRHALLDRVLLRGSVLVRMGRIVPQPPSIRPGASERLTRFE